MSKTKPKAKPVAKKPPVKPSKAVAKVAPPKKSEKPDHLRKKIEPSKPVQKQMTGKLREAKKGDNSGPELDFDTGQETVYRSPGQLKKLVEKGDELLDLQAKIEKISALLADTQSAANEIANKELPKLLSDLQLTSFKTTKGIEIELQDKLVGTFPKEPAAKEAAFEIIEEREGGDIIKSFVTVAFAKSEFEKAQTLMEELKERDLPAELDKTVNHQTFMAWARDWEDDESNADNPLPLDKLGLSYIHYARVKEAKKPRRPSQGN